MIKSAAAFYKEIVNPLFEGDDLKPFQVWEMMEQYAEYLDKKRSCSNCKFWSAEIQNCDEHDNAYETFGCKHFEEREGRVQTQNSQM